MFIINPDNQGVRVVDLQILLVGTEKV